MALLSIAEPGQSKPPHSQQRRLAVGIDLGTTNSLVAAFDGEKTVTLPDIEGRNLLPSIVHYGADGKVSVGHEALPYLLSDPLNTVSSVKRLMGRGAVDQTLDFPYQLVTNEAGGMPFIKTAAGEISPVEVSAKILSELLSRAKQKLGGEIEGAVITVPAYFDEAQRQATKDAARIAGINVLRLLSEPTAAAVAYGLDNNLEGTVIIYDLGGGTFDVSLMRLEKGVFEVLATGGDTALGGDDIDQAIVAWIKRQAGLNGEPTTSQLSQLNTIAKQSKHQLSASDSASIEFESWKGQLDRDVFNTCIDPIIEKTLKACRRVLRDAGLKSEDVSEVVMVGGSTRSIRVKEKISAFFNKPLLCDIDPDQVVAIGAAKQADALVGNKYGNDMLLLDVIPLSLGIETMGGLMEKIIPRNTTIPVARAQEFTTFKDGQTVMSLHVLQGERELVSDCRSLARFDLRDIPPMVAGAARIKVTFQVDADGLMEVTAQEVNSGVQSNIVVKPSFGLEDAEIESMIKDAYSGAEHDKDVRSLREAQVEALRIIEAIEAALKEDGRALLSDKEFESLHAGVETLKAATETEDTNHIHALSEALNEQSQDFAALRMDSKIKQALAGHTIKEFEEASSQTASSQTTSRTASQITEGEN